MQGPAQTPPLFTDLSITPADASYMLGGEPGWFIDVDFAVAITDTGGLAGAMSGSFLRGPDSLEDFTAEIPPVDGTMLMFKCTRDAWHGHHSYEGPRHVLQLNWMVDEATKQREEGRHKVSAFLKKLNPFG